MRDSALATLMLSEEVLSHPGRLQVERLDFSGEPQN